MYVAVSINAECIAFLENASVMRCAVEPLEMDDIPKKTMGFEVFSGLKCQASTAGMAAASYCRSLCTTPAVREMSLRLGQLKKVNGINLVHTMKSF